MRMSRCLLALSLPGFLAPAVAQNANHPPTNWWPEPSSGLMWAGTLHPDLDIIPANLTDGLLYQDAANYCAGLTIAGFSGWRLPTLDEVKAATELEPESAQYFNLPEPHAHWVTVQIRALQFKGRSVEGIPQECRNNFWTSTSDDSASHWAVVLDCPRVAFGRAGSTAHAPALCVRPLDPDMEALAKGSHVDIPISTMQDLQAYFALSQAQASDRAGQFSDGLQKALSSLQLKPDLIPANIGVGILYGELGQWDQAVKILQSARSRLDWNNRNIKAALKWAKNGQKAAAKGKPPKGKAPAWN
jgi:hypothetical protein